MILFAVAAPDAGGLALGVGPNSLACFGVKGEDVEEDPVLFSIRSAIARTNSNDLSFGVAQVQNVSDGPERIWHTHFRLPVFRSMATTSAPLPTRSASVALAFFELSVAGLRLSTK